MNTAEMRAAIARAGKTYRGLAKSLGISEQAFYNKLNGESDFKASEIKVLRGELNLTSEEINYIFFSTTRELNSLMVLNRKEGEYG